MQEQFTISDKKGINPKNSYLAMQLGSRYFSYCIYEPESKKLLELKRYLFEHIDTDKLDIMIAKNPILEGEFDKIITELDFGISALLPSNMSNGDATPIMYLESADQQDHVITEYLDEQKLANLYTVPANILTWMVHNFPSSGYMHSHTVQIKNITSYPVGGVLRVDVSENSFNIVVFKGERLLLTNAYKYTSPADMVFYLIKICGVFGLLQEEVELVVSGLIDIDSKLYRELYDYFLHISLKPVSWTDRISNLPAHYFTSLNELTICELLLEA